MANYDCVYYAHKSVSEGRKVDLVAPKDYIAACAFYSKFFFPFKNY